MFAVIRGDAASPSAPLCSTANPAKSAMVLYFGGLFHRNSSRVAGGAVDSHKHGLIARRKPRRHDHIELLQTCEARRQALVSHVRVYAADAYLDRGINDRQRRRRRR